MLVPLLNEKFYGWDKAVLSGAEKAADEAEVLETIQTDTSFYQLPRALKIRALLKAANQAGCDTAGFGHRVGGIFGVFR